MNRPLESDYTSQVAYTRALEAYCDTLEQPVQEPVGRFAKFTDGIWREVTDGSAGQPLYTASPKQESRNFCPRCGKRRGGDVNYFHTCTPPRGLEMT